MAETPADVLVAGPPDIDGATKDFGSLGELVRDTQVSIDGVIVVTRAQMAVPVRQTCRNLGRGRLGRGGGTGVAVGLFVPPPLASVAVGLSRAWSLVSSLVIASSGTSAAILILKGERCEPESSRH